jgi:hypothetical protein
MKEVNFLALLNDFDLCKLKILLYVAVFKQEEH